VDSSVNTVNNNSVSVVCITAAASIYSLSGHVDLQSAVSSECDGYFAIKE